MAKDVQMSIKMEHELRGRFMVMQWITDAQPLRSQFRPLCDIHTPEKHDFERQITAEKLSINNCFWFRFSHSFLKTCLEELYPHFDGYPLKAFHY
ncbi:MAG: hypothetical protein M0R33_16245 [Methylomonas sp.]|jgi:hypothetical protein|uniref:hypothetical protein n=1 Tax=Methylomonas sp. TaxID=418 RepID=UPI0025DCD95B|nr:hypothetical protein [Methylomonas sp.]MCK9607993.1 hypothetical protein [Methylomonas sp.]